MLYSVQLKNMYSYLNSSLKLSDIVRCLLSTIVLQLIIIIQNHHIPSHIGIQGNEMVDKRAKSSLSLEPTSFKIPFSF